jgi:hypothetical protein
MYEATEGGAGVLTRLVAEPERLGEVARRALSIMHFAGTGVADLPANIQGLVDLSDTSCVAACYRCLMSYYNQPDHELIDRRNADAKTFLLRLAHSTTTGLDAPISASAAPGVAPDTRAGRWLDLARGRDLPALDATPLVVVTAQVPIVWRSHYVAAILDESTAPPPGELEAKGFEVIVFGSDEALWPDAFSRLAKALGRTS